MPAEAVVATSRAIYNKVKSGKTGISDIDDGTIGEDDWVLVVILLAVFFGIPVYMLVRYLLEVFGVIKPDTSQRNKNKRSSRRHDDDFFPPFFSEEAEALRVAAFLEAPLAEVPLAVEEPAEDGKSGMLGKNLSGRLLRAGPVVY